MKSSEILREARKRIEARNAIDQLPKADILFPNDQDFRAYRLAWIDWMIEGYEAIGD